MTSKDAMVVDDSGKDNGSIPVGVEDMMIIDDDRNKDGGSEPGGVGETVLVLHPVGLGESGEGMPYAPENWPEPGDNWRWRVGRRTLLNGYMWDRFLIPPSRLSKPRKSGQRKVAFPSIQGVSKFLQEEIPNADVDAFFKSFCWKIPSNEFDWQKDQLLYSITPLRGESAQVKHSGHESNTLTMGCKARNKMCSDQQEARSNSLPDMDCDICCSEVSFCRNCCCILCSNVIDWIHGGYSFFRCEAKQGEGHICGHAAHLNCALRSYMAGKVGGSIGLDVEYYCRRCDKKTDLVPHVTGLLQTCQSLNSPDEIEKILKLGLSILRGSQRVSALNLLKSIELAFRKLKSGSYLEEIWNMEGNISPSPGAQPHMESERPLVENTEVSAGSYPLNVDASELKVQKSCQEPLYITSDHQIESVKLEKEVEQVLQELKKSQQVEYETAKAKLYAKKHAILNLYQKLDAEKSKMDNQSSSSSKNSDMDAILSSILNRVNEIKRELLSLKDMVQIAKGFGRTAAGILKERFGFGIED